MPGLPLGKHAWRAAPRMQLHGPRMLGLVALTPRGMQPQLRKGIKSTSDAAHHGGITANEAVAPAEVEVPAASSGGNIGTVTGSVQSHPLAGAQDMFAAEELVSELTDTSALGKRGELYFAAQALAILLVVFPPFQLSGLFDFLGIFSLTAGLALCAVGLWTIGRNISPLPAPRSKHALVTTGLYAYIRHPMYGGLILASLGLAATTYSESRLAVAILLWMILEQKVAFEERCLVARYGVQYEEYCKKTKKFIPYLY